MPFTAEELADMAAYDAQIEREFKQGKIKADPIAEKYADIDRSKKAAYQREYCAKNREKYNAYQREYRARMKEKYPDRWNEFARA